MCKSLIDITLALKVFKVFDVCQDRTGAISMLSGFCRMTVSLVVIMFELTGLLQSSNCCFLCPTEEWRQGVGLRCVCVCVCVGGGNGRCTFTILYVMMKVES